MRQLCAVEFKNHAKLRWSPGSEDIQPLLAEEKAALRGALVRVCVECPLESVRTQLLVVLREVLNADFPAGWPEALPEVVNFVIAPPASPRHLIGALDCLHLVFKQFEFFTPDEEIDDRKPLHDLVDATFPVLFRHLTAANADPSEHGAAVRKLVAKIFWKAIMYDEPPMLRDKRADRIAPWIEAFIAALEVPLLPVRSGVDAARSPGWSSRKHVVDILRQLFERFGEPNRDFKNKARRAFATAFGTRFFGSMVGAILMQLAALAEGVDVPDRFVSTLLETLISGVVPYDAAYAALQPHLLSLITGLVFPLAQPTEAHIVRFQDDPRDFLRREFELDMSQDEIFGSGSAALHFFRQTFLSRPELMPDLVQFLVGELDRYSRGETTPAVKCAALHVLGTCNRMLLQRTAPFLERMPHLLSVYVFPELDAADGVLRARACWTLQQFSAVIGDIGAEAASATVQKLLERMRDPALPVRVMAACALGVFVDNRDIKPQLEPLVGDLLHAFLGMMDEVESDVLILSMQHIVQEFEETVVPHAISLMTAILNKFGEYAALAAQGGDGDGGDDDEGGVDDDGGEAVMAAAQCLSAVRQVLLACELVEDVQFWSSMTQLLLGLAKFIGQGASETFLEEVSQTLSLLIYVPPNLPPNAWDIYDPLMSAYEHGNDTLQLSAMLAPLDNLIERANDGLFVGNRLDRLYRSVRACVLDEETNDAVVIDAIRIYESLILCCGGADIKATRSEERPPGRIDALLPSLISDMLTRLQVAEQRMLKCVLIDTLMECFLYSTPLTLAALDAAGATDVLLRAVLECDIKAFFQRMHDKKMVAMGLTALLFSTPLATLPANIRGLAPVLLAYTLRVIDALQAQSVEFTEEEEKRNEMLDKLRSDHPHLTEDELRELVSEAQFANEFGDVPEAQRDDDDDEEDDGADEEDYGDEFGGIVDNMSNIKRLADKAAAARGGDFDDIDLAGDMGLEGELSYMCPLDPIQEYVLFYTRFEECKELEPQLLEQIVGAMLPDDRELIQNVAEQFAAYQQDLLDNADNDNDN